MLVSQFHWAYPFTVVVVLIVVFVIRYYELSRFKMRTRMKIAELSAKNLKDLDRRKTMFFTNISHEFRTPLTLIRGPLEHMLNESNDPHQKKSLKAVYDNASRLEHLVDQLLDLSMIENDKYLLRVRKCDLVGYIQGLVMSFNSMAEQKKIKIDFKLAASIDIEKLKSDFYYDEDVFHKVIFNLISNAIKYTSEGGHVCCELDMKKTDDGLDHLEILVEDTGIGIKDEHLEHIFDRFYKVDTCAENAFSSTGIGLAYVKELVVVHKGSIAVKSELGKGTRFTLLFPLGMEHYSSEQIIPDSQPLADYQTPVERQNLIANLPVITENKDREEERPWALVIEDHEDVRKYINLCLQTDFRVIEAPTGVTGFILAEEYIPDIIISDIMMPEMDGFKLCERLRSSEKTDHIPIILLTAKVASKDRIEGLEKGADAYITKPFDGEELSVRARNLVENRKALKQKFSDNTIVSQGEISVHPKNSIFVKKLLKIVEGSIGNAKFSVEDLGKEACLSHSQLHRKLKAVVNMSANQFIRSVRMNRAMDLLQKEAGNISEISFMVGYDDPGYFTKSFRKFFGKLPSEVQLKESENELT